jgi:hypothetical protein
MKFKAAKTTLPPNLYHQYITHFYPGCQLITRPAKLEKIFNDAIHLLQTNYCRQVIICQHQ